MTIVSQIFFHLLSAKFEHIFMTDYNNSSPDNYNLDTEDSYIPRIDPEFTKSSNQDSYSIEDDDEGEGEEEHESEYISDDDSDTPPEAEAESASGQIPAWRQMLGIMINPVEGWKSIRRSRRPVENVAKDCFYPLIAMAAASCYLECFWNKKVSINQATIEAITVFTAFFFGNFMVLMLIKFFFPSALREIADSDYCKTYVMYNLSTLALFFIAYEAFPMVKPVLEFLPLWTIYLTLRGARFFLFPKEKQSLLNTLLCIFVLGAPIIVYWVMGTLL